MFNFLKRIKIYKLANALIIKSGIIKSGETNTNYNYFLINEDISINFRTFICYGTSRNPYIGTTHTLFLKSEILIKNIKVKTFELRKDLLHYKIDDICFSIEEEENIHKLKSEWINSINQWANKICIEYDNVKLDQIEQEKNNKLQKYKKDKKILNNL
jgi:hypothetical protein